ncbi:glycosyltransferase family 2 protein [Paraburkholderia fungorum]
MSGFTKTPTTEEASNASGKKTGGANVGAVIVTYRPDIAKLARVIESTVPQVDRVIVVDNGSPEPLTLKINELCVKHGARLLEQSSNIGIAAAQNRGIEALLAQQYDYVLLLDHDSVPAEGMVDELVRADTALRSQGHSVGAVGPVCEDFRTGSQWPFIRLENGVVRRVACSQECPLVRTDFLIASGSLIHQSVFRVVGLMNEAFFIDHVDTEWCLRASAAGLSIFGVCAARLDHELGDRIVRLWFFRWREVPVHTPVRMYYMFRNTIRMLAGTPMRWSWRVVHTFRLLQFVFFYSLLVAPRRTYFKAMFLGVLDAVQQRMYAIRRSL